MFSWLNFLSYAVVTAVTPGPNNLMSLSNAGRLGFRRALQPGHLGGVHGGHAALYSLLRRAL